LQYKWIALTVTTIGTFMAGLDGRILVVGLPTVARELHASTAEVIWIGQAYLLAGTVGLLLVGRIADQFGRVKLYNLGFVIFTIGSLLCSFAQNATQLIGFRVIQGIGFALLITNSYAIVVDASPKSELGTMLGINQTAIRLGNVAGLTLSGIVLSIVDWRGLFYVNIPIGIFGTVWAYRRLQEISVLDPSKKMDWAGFVLFSIGLTSVLLGITYLSYGASSVDFGFGLLFLGFIFLVIFAKVESSIPNPLLDLKLFKIRSFAMGGVAQLLNSIVVNSIVVLLAFYFQVGLGYSPLQAGLAILPLDGTYMVFSLWGGKLSDKYSPQILATIGLVIGTISVLGMVIFGETTGYVVLAFVIAFVGVGNGIFNPTNTRAIVSGVPVNRIGIASGFRQTMFNLGLTASYGVSILFLTFGIPYSLLSPLVQGTISSGLLTVARSDFLIGFRIALILLAIINASAIAPSLMRGKPVLVNVD
jgi:EmrB/QacA subfamily drug resistance transporter